MPFVVRSKPQGDDDVDHYATACHESRGFKLKSLFRSANAALIRRHTAGACRRPHIFDPVSI
jgi:hypothetical protein